jgi:hypothetical protein
MQTLRGALGGGTQEDRERHPVVEGAIWLLPCEARTKTQGTILSLHAQTQKSGTARARTQLPDTPPLEHTRNASIYKTTTSAPRVTPPRPETMSSRHAEGIVLSLSILYSLYQTRSTYWRISYAPILLLSPSHMLHTILREFVTDTFGHAYSYYSFAFDTTLQTCFHTAFAIGCLY